MRKRNHSIYIRMTDDEYERLMNRIESTGKTQQAYILDAALNSEITSDETIEKLKLIHVAFADIDKQLRGIGTNINQMAHVANGKGELPAAETMVRMSEDIRKIRNEVMDKWQQLRLSINLLSHTAQ